MNVREKAFEAVQSIIQTMNVFECRNRYCILLYCISLAARYNFKRFFGPHFITFSYDIRQYKAWYIWVSTTYILLFRKRYIFLENTMIEKHNDLKKKLLFNFLSSSFYYYIIYIIYFFLMTLSIKYSEV